MAVWGVLPAAARPDVLPPSRQPPPPLSSSLGWNPILLRGQEAGSRGGERNPHSSALSMTSSCIPETLLQLKALSPLLGGRGESGNQSSIFFSCPQSPGNSTQPTFSCIKVQYSAKRCANNAIHDGLRPQNFQYFLFADWLS